MEDLHKLLLLEDRNPYQMIIPVHNQSQYNDLVFIYLEMFLEASRSNMQLAQNRQEILYLYMKKYSEIV